MMSPQRRPAVPLRVYGVIENKDKKYYQIFNVWNHHLFVAGHNMPTLVSLLTGEVTRADGVSGMNASFHI